MTQRTASEPISATASRSYTISEHTCSTSAISGIASGPDSVMGPLNTQSALIRTSVGRHGFRVELGLNGVGAGRDYFIGLEARRARVGLPTRGGRGAARCEWRARQDSNLRPED